MLAVEQARAGPAQREVSPELGRCVSRRWRWTRRRRGSEFGGRGAEGTSFTSTVSARRQREVTFFCNIRRVARVLGFKTVGLDKPPSANSTLPSFTDRAMRRCCPVAGAGDVPGGDWQRTSEPRPCADRSTNGRCASTAQRDDSPALRGRGRTGCCASLRRLRPGPTGRPPRRSPSSTRPRPRGPRSRSRRCRHLLSRRLPHSGCTRPDPKRTNPRTARTTCGS